MQIIDAQVHIWGSGTPSGHHRQTSVYTAEELIAEMDEAGVNGAVLHPPSWDNGSNELAVEAARKYPDRFCILGWFPLDEPEQRKRIETWKQRPGMLGSALVADARRSGELARGRHDGLAVAGGGECRHAGRDHGLALPAAVQADRRAASEPEADHRSSWPGPRRRKATRRSSIWTTLLALAKCPNVAVKATGAPGYSAAPYPFRDIHDGLHRIFDAYGPERFFWGTDITRMPCSYRQCVTMFTEELPWLKGKRPGTRDGPGRVRLAGMAAQPDMTHND